MVIRLGLETILKIFWAKRNHQKAAQERTPGRDLPNTWALSSKRGRGSVRGKGAGLVNTCGQGFFTGFNKENIESVSLNACFTSYCSHFPKKNIFVSIFGDVVVARCSRIRSTLFSAFDTYFFTLQHISLHLNILSFFAIAEVWRGKSA